MPSRRHFLAGSAAAAAGLALAYATFRKGRGNRLSSAFVP
ncbi:twin-arginine translocation signal domain-containing protein, partial [Streptomyces sp. BF23-30]